MSLVLLLLSVLPREDAVRESVDLIEHNHVYNDNGDLHLEQMVYYEWKGGRYEVLSWRLRKSPLMVPYRDHTNGGYTAVWVDDQSVTRVVRALAFRESHTMYDPELLERNRLPREFRRELKQAKGR
jgi:hypothetical protein